MSLYQSSVLSKYLASQDASEVANAYTKYTQYFLNNEIQQNIRNSKEEQFQEGFLRELFVNVLGYTINPNPGFNLTTELKNIKDAKKTDGAILHKDGTALAVIELKGTDTKDLAKVNDQAFNYKNNQPECVYVITSNFEKLRFFIHNAVEHEEFNLFALTKDRFALLWLFLQKDNLLGGIPAKVKQESLLQEEKITKALYADYSAFKNDLWEDMVKQNPKHDPLLLYQKSQKLLDRFLFIFFAEDKGLLPPNSISSIVQQWNKLTELDEYKPLYDRFKKYFGYMNDGYQGAKYEIHAYNGGLFKQDELLDNLLIDDSLLEKHCIKLTKYDFNDEVDTNILGHIFEHSLNDIENVRAELAGEEVDKSKTKRKKDGVFYTPKYITKYIVDNTVGRLCEEKKAEIGIDEEEFAKDRKGRKKATIKKLDAQLKEYRAWLLQLTICDPACGSGAFLNQALEFLMAEHRYVDELDAALFEGSIVFQDVENHILENNIYGVDINEESVEIARLSLWLRTAQKGRKLTSLSSNIKVGNSLIDDPKVAGDLAFNWQEQFPSVLAKGGFDAVIGNPPYGASLSSAEKTWLKANYTITQGVFDTYLFFFERTYNILSQNGITGVITPNTFLVIEYADVLRNFLYTKMTVLSFLEVFNVFTDAVVEPIVSIFQKSAGGVKSNFVVKLVPRGLKVVDDVSYSTANTVFSVGEVYQNEKLIFNYRIKEPEKKLLRKLLKIDTTIGDVTIVKAGVKPYERGKGLPPQTADVVKVKPFNGYEKLDETWRKVVRGSDVTRHKLDWAGEYMKYGEWLAAPRSASLFDEPKIFMRRTDDKLMASLDTTGMVGINSVHCIQLKECNNEESLLALQALLNSKLLDWVFKIQNFHMVGKPLAEVKVIFVQRLPYLESKDLSLVQLVKRLSEDQNDSSKHSASFLQHLQSKFDIEKPSTKLKNWPSLDSKGFLAELKKAKVQLTLQEEAEWMKYFNEEKAKANALQTEIDRIDKEIDQMVYQLYGLTEEEIEIVEEA